MGYGLPAAIAAKIADPKRVVIAVCGDGDFMMNCQELATAARYESYPIILVVNNGMLGTIRMHQEREYKSRISGTNLTNPNFVQLAASYHMLGFQIKKTEQFQAAFKEALASSQGSIIELVTDPEASTPTKRLSELS
jgi:acetolactate synthase-1/2/3 large subunit